MVEDLIWQKEISFYMSDHPWGGLCSNTKVFFSFLEENGLFKRNTLPHAVAVGTKKSCLFQRSTHSFLPSPFQTPTHPTRLNSHTPDHV